MCAVPLPEQLGRKSPVGSNTVQSFLIWEHTVVLGALKPPVATTHPHTRTGAICTPELGKNLPWHSSSHLRQFRTLTNNINLMIKNNVVCFNDQLLRYFPSHNSWLHIGPLLNGEWRKDPLWDNHSICVSVIKTSSAKKPTCSYLQMPSKQWICPKMAEHIQEDAPVLKVPSPTHTAPLQGQRPPGTEREPRHSNKVPYGMEVCHVHRNPASRSPHQSMVLLEGRAMILFSSNSESRVLAAHVDASDLLVARKICPDSSIVAHDPLFILFSLNSPKHHFKSLRP